MLILRPESPLGGGGRSSTAPPIPPSSLHGNVTSWNKSAANLLVGTSPRCSEDRCRIFAEGDKQAQLRRQSEDAVSTGKGAKEGWRLRKDGNPSGAAFLGMVSISARAWLTRPKGPSRLSHRRSGQSLTPYPRPSSLSSLSGPHISRQGKTRECPRFLKRSRARVRLASANGRLIQKASR